MSDTFVQDGAASDQVWYTIDDRGPCAVLTVGGRVDSDNCPGVCDAALVASGLSSGLVVDMSRAEFTQAEAAGLVVRSLQRSHHDGASVCVVDPPEPVGWLLRVSAEVADIPTCATVTEAMAVLSTSTRTAPLPP